ncbi:phage antitermination protein Q [Komagataeibacter europaeus]|uniref:Phage antitermination protein Q n=1 Tax=Komagataeibacter europaeus TaxID=33995 RepID=A0A0M0EC00_KOMEU|nr:bacteriophage antitermination protein Q [Komagataeibacter europaeus]KON62789.1 phage antitermination protein Q [Komagataeibacter europaeus]
MLQFDYVRTSLSSALLCITVQRDEKPDESRVFADKTNQSFQSKPMREIALDDRTIRVEATPVHCSETRPYKGGKLLINNNAYRMSSWRRVVSLLPPAYESWIRYCYGDSIVFGHQEILCHHVWSAFIVYQREVGAPRMSKKVKESLQRLVWLSVQESKKFVNRGAFAYVASDLALLLGVTPNNWNQCYQPRWKALLQIMVTLDREALIHAEQKHREESRLRRSSAVPV